jgi:hypothetical protein
MIPKLVPLGAGDSGAEMHVCAHGAPRPAGGFFRHGPDARPANPQAPCARRALPSCLRCCVPSRVSSRDSGQVAWAATRFVLRLGATLRLVHIGSHTTAEDVPAIAKTMSATRLVVSADGQGVNPELILDVTDVPVMLIPLGVAQRMPKRRGERR